MLVCWPGNECSWHEETRCRNAGCSELYIVHLSDTFAIIALQHNSGTTAGVPQVSALHHPSCLLNPHRWARAGGKKQGGGGSAWHAAAYIHAQTRWQWSLRSFGSATCPGAARCSAQLSGREVWSFLCCLSRLIKMKGDGGKQWKWRLFACLWPQLAGYLNPPKALP